jgi:hypothetical protein
MKTLMGRRRWALITVLPFLMVVSECFGDSPQANDAELARLLAHAETQKQAIAQIVAARDSRVPELLSWTRNTPSGLNPLELHELNIGMAVAFGQLKTKEAIPFLIRNLTLNRFPITNVWTRSAEVILDRLPAVAALIQIGPDASRAIIQTPWNEMSAHDRLAAVFVVSRVAGVTEAREFLTSALGEANMLRERAEEGLQFLESHH